MRTCSSRKRWISALLLGAHQQRAAAVIARRLQLAQALLGLRELRFEAVLGRAELEVRLTAQRLDRRERARVGRAAAQADQRGAAREIVERVDDEVAVVRERRDEALAQEVLRLDPEPVAQHVDVTDEHEVGIVRGSQVSGRERGVDGRFAVGGGRRAVRERGLERPFEACGEHELFAARREAVQELGRVRQELEALGRHRLRLDARRQASASASPWRRRRARNSPATPRFTELKPEVIGSSWLIASASRPIRPM